LRRELVRRQQEILAEGRVVLEGRDTTTVVCPDARLQVFLTASVQERARRRWMELTAKGPSPSLEEIERQIEERDNRDITREDSPLKIAPDAVVIDTDGKTIPEVLAELLSAWNEASTPRG
jgi:cytidylate kinase